MKSKRLMVDLSSYYQWLQQRQLVDRQKTKVDSLDKLDKKEERRKAADLRQQLRPLRQQLEKHDKAMQQAQT